MDCKFELQGCHGDKNREKLLKVYKGVKKISFPNKDLKIIFKKL